MFPAILKRRRRCTAPSAHYLTVEGTMIAFDHTHNPPAPVIEITGRNPLNRRLRRSLPALLDTGSDVTAIPEAIRVAL